MRLRSVLSFVGLFALGACEKAPSTVAGSPTQPTVTPSATASAVSSSSKATEPDPAPAPTTETAMPPKSETQNLAASSNRFAFELWSRARTAAPGNMAVSPASISAALAMTYGGANGTTADEMKKVLHADAGADELMTAWGTLSKALTAPSRPNKLAIANRLFGQKSYVFQQPYLDRVRTTFGAPLEPLDFQGAPDPSRVRINGWVSEQTNDRIKDLLPSGAITPLTRLVLVNAIYFLGTWQARFDPAKTKDEPWLAPLSKKKQVPMMHQQNNAHFAQANGVKLLELPYTGGSTSLLIALPDRVDGLGALESSLTSATFDGWRQAVMTQPVVISLPRFEVNAGAVSLGKQLAALGMPSAFDPNRADFTKMATPANPNERLNVDDVFHKAFVKLDEKGTEAAAATGVVMSSRGMDSKPPKPVEFKADHPFLFFIVDKDSGLILFMGRVTEP
jgi:serpin B